MSIVYAPNSLYKKEESLVRINSNSQISELRLGDVLTNSLVTQFVYQNDLLVQHVSYDPITKQMLASCKYDPTQITLTTYAAGQLRLNGEIYDVPAGVQVYSDLVYNTQGLLTMLLDDSTKIYSTLDGSVKLNLLYAPIEVGSIKVDYNYNTPKLIVDEITNYMVYDNNGNQMIGGWTLNSAGNYSWSSF